MKASGKGEMSKGGRGERGRGRGGERGRKRGERGRGVRRADAGRPAGGRGGVQPNLPPPVTPNNPALGQQISTVPKVTVQRAATNSARAKIIGAITILTVVLGGVGAGVYFSIGSGDEGRTDPSADLSTSTTRKPTTTPSSPETTTTPPPPIVLNEEWIAARGDCGRPRQKPNLGRIVGGTEAVKHSWPWQAGILKYKQYDSKTASVKAMCGGSLIGPKYVLTAAHCFLNLARTSLTKDGDRFRVLVGGHDKGRETHGAKMIEIESINHHPDNNLAVYKRLKQIPSYDLSVLVLKTIIDPDVVSPMTGFVCLPQPELRPYPGRECWATGWGLTQGTGHSKQLKQVITPIVSKQVCSKKYGGRMIKDELHVCGGPHKGSQGTCQGDSGGPLVCQYDDGAWVLHGATSFGPQPCGTNPSAWAQVSHQLDFICCIMKDYGPCKDKKCELDL